MIALGRHQLDTFMADMQPSVKQAGANILGFKPGPFFFCLTVRQQRLFSRIAAIRLGLRYGVHVNLAPQRIRDVFLAVKNDRLPRYGGERIERG